MKTIAFHLNCLVQGGAERVVSNLANQFSKEGYKVYVATEWEDENEFKLLPEVTRVHVGLRAEDEKKNNLQYLIDSSIDIPFSSYVTILVSDSPSVPVYG